MPVDILAYGYAATVAAGGIIGYAKAGSVMSLGAGLLFGGTLGYGAHQVSQDPQKYHLSLATSSVLTTMMGYRFLSGGKFMPAGLIAGISVLFVARYGVRALTGTKQ
ncbi:transmembrane protein 14C-like [Pollicipes pollicipes]|uniref:transmembrane protein 14C-like n=1 Tax=Pollicipes pollicipes TaxID=41117 RepID=UPI0018849288|nr:transmembrane protein 14C-like [Pollicipes pollicipes]XP_037085306.1 transmembrane protein 14C-like [Pollicipes pollicipes]XP_037086014.1 transmembrane protein 14C-like [Pollicipes pollicipes]XP_037086015.1 transmembrane protein 14C-like [Pollicipes pollicipes]